MINAGLPMARNKLEKSVNQSWVSNGSCAVNASQGSNQFETALAKLSMLNR